MGYVALSYLTYIPLLWEVGSQLHSYDSDLTGTIFVFFPTNPVKFCPVLWIRIRSSRNRIQIRSRNFKSRIRIRKKSFRIHITGFVDAYARSYGVASIASVLLPSTHSGVQAWLFWCCYLVPKPRATTTNFAAHA